MGFDRGRTPKVSVVIPTFQRASILKRTINDLLSQTLNDIEIIVVDDGSTDQTPQVVASFEDPRVRYGRRDHVGMPRILNEGIGLARGGYVMICHDHDIYAPTLLEDLSDALDRYSSATYAHCGVIVVEPVSEREVERYVKSYPPLAAGKKFLKEELLPGLDCKVPATSMVRASALTAKLDASLGPSADVELWLRLSTIGDVAYVEKPLIQLRQRDVSSELYRIGRSLMRAVLETKTHYLSYVEDTKVLHSIVRGWRKEVTRGGFAAMLRALEMGDLEEARALESFIRSKGTRMGGLLARGLLKMPIAVSLSLLRLARILVTSG